MGIATADGQELKPEAWTPTNGWDAKKRNSERFANSLSFIPFANF
jgi:hypothetical protein